MKVSCPRCNTEGFLEARGNSYRIKHYLGYTNGKRKYTGHTDKKGSYGNKWESTNGNKYHKS